MKSIKGTKTEQNLLKSFAGESQARMRYDYFAKQAKKDGLVQISLIFAETALNEKEHAKRFFKFLEGGDTEIIAIYPAGKIGTTLENLKASADGKNEEWEELYPHFADVAEEEGFKAVASAFRAIAEADKAHEDTFRTLYTNLDEGRMFERNGVVVWKCLNCGYLHEAEKAPKVCPACLHPQDYFKVEGE